MQIFYSVRPGEYLYQIAERWGLPLHTLIASNNLSYPYTIYPGQQLSIPPGLNRYNVKKNDTLYKISEKFGIPAQLIAEINHLSPPYAINIGDTLVIPQGLPYYLTKTGDTLYNIAQRYNVMKNGIPNYELIMRINKLSDENIVPNMRLKIPYSHHSERGTIYYVSNKGGQYDIWSYNLKNRRNSQITNSICEDYTVPFVSPDGKKIAFVGKNNIIYVLNINNKAISKIDQTNPYTHIGWSSDNKFIAYGNGREIAIYNLEKHRARKLQIQRAQDVQFMPDNENLLYHSYDESNSSQIYIIGVDGKNKKQLPKAQEGQVNFLKLSPDGKYISYTLPGASISIINIMELSTGKMLTAPEGQLAKNYNPIWSPDSSKILYSSTSYKASSYFSLVKTFNPTTQTDFVWSISNCYLTPLAWSPDGGKFIYLTDCDRKNFNKIWMMSLTHPAPIMLLEGGDIVSLAFSLPSDS